MKDCCSIKNITTDSEIGDYCINCYSINDGLKFETPFIGDKTDTRTRKNKFFQLVYSVELPWYVRQTLIDIFPRIEGHFNRSNRINFIHMSQLIIELLKITGNSSHCHKFTGLKTLTRTKLVQLFVLDAIGFEATGSAGNTRSLNDLELITPLLDYTVDMRKVVDNGHIYSDR